MCFKVYGFISMKQALEFLQDFKLGHYMKVPPRIMFMAQVVGTLTAAFVYLGTAWWLMDTIPNICDVERLSADSPWTCPGDHVFDDASVHMGSHWPKKNIRGPGNLLGGELVLLGGSYHATPRLAGAQGVPGAEVDPARQHARDDRLHPPDATRHRGQLQHVDTCWGFCRDSWSIDIGVAGGSDTTIFFRFGCAGCWLGVHGRLDLLCA